MNLNQSNPQTEFKAPFAWDYEFETVKNKGGSNSKWGVVYGAEGIATHCRKEGSYHVIPTSEINALAENFHNQGIKMSSYCHKFGEQLGLNLDFDEAVLTAVGDITYKGILHIKNDGNGVGYLSIQEERLICTNGMRRKFNMMNRITIPHNSNMTARLELCAQAVEQFKALIELAQKQDATLNSFEVTNEQVRYLLTKWYFEKEMPKSQKPDGYTLSQFRADLVSDKRQEIKSIDRYDSLIAAWNREEQYNGALNLTRSMYTVFASITNYLSRRVEKSRSAASIEMQQERVSKKVDSFFAPFLEAEVNIEELIAA